VYRRGRRGSTVAQAWPAHTTPCRGGRQRPRPEGGDVGGPRPTVVPYSAPSNRTRPVGVAISAEAVSSGGSIAERAIVVLALGLTVAPTRSASRRSVSTSAMGTASSGPFRAIPPGTSRIFLTKALG
jgi:hypothetical protein